MERIDTNLILNDVYDNMDGTIRLRRFDSNYIFNAIYDPDAPGLRVNKILDMNSTDLNDMPKPLVADKYLRVNSNGDAYELSDIQYSSGIIQKPTFSWDSNTGVFTVENNGIYQVFSDNNYSLPIKTVTDISASLDINDYAVNYIVLDWSAGVTKIDNLPDRRYINQSCIIPLFTIYREGVDIHYLDWDEMGKGLSNKLCDRLVRTERFVKESGGLFLSEIGSRDIYIDEGTVWYGATSIYLESLKLGGSLTELYYHSFGNWIKSSVYEYDNLHYDDGTNIQKLHPNKYGVNYIFRFVENYQHTGIILGAGDYNYDEAINALIPAMPEIISTQCIYVGKIIVKKGENTGKIIQAASGENGVAAVADHTLLSKLVWPNSGHTADVNRVAVFDDNGNSNTDSSLIWDYANKRLGVGITPTTTFHVNGLMTANGYYNQVSGFVEGNVFKNPYGQAYGYIRFGATNFADKDMMISTNNVERLRILSDGKVGIGTSAPEAGLHLVSTLGYFLLTDSMTDSTIKALRIGTKHYTNSEESAAGLFIQSGSNFNIVAYGGGTPLFNAATTHQWYTAANNTTPTGSVRMTLAGNGFLGIGTTTPSYKLDVQGSVSTDAISTNVGLEFARTLAPTIAPTLSLTTGNNLGVGTYYYTVTYVTLLGETNIGPYASILTSSGNQTVNLTNIPVSSDIRVTSRKIYRTKSGATSDSTYYLGIINDNVTTTFTDTLSDAALTGVVFQSYRSNTTNKFITVGGIRAMFIDTNLVSLGIGAANTLIAGGNYPSIRSTYIGTGAGQNVTTGTSNTIVGYTFGSATTAGSCTLMGELAGYVITTGSGNSIFGAQAGRFLTTGTYNTMIGQDCARYLNDGSTQLTAPNYGVYIGYGAKGYGATEINSIVIGYNALGLGNNSVVLGNDSITKTALKGKIGIGTSTPADSLDVKGTARFGDSTTNYTQFEADGTMKMVGNATVYDDLTGDITRTKTVGIRVTLNDTENTIDFNNACTLSDYLFLNYQMSHKWEAGSTLFPHIHYEQSNNNIPNFLFQYRWQRQGQAKTTAWTNAICNVNVFTYTSGTLNQIADSVSITPPTNYGMSDIIEFRIIRDTANASGLFAGADTYTGTVSITSVDIHYKMDTLGSRTEYTK